MKTSFFEAIKQGNRYEVERQLILDPALIHCRENGLSPVMVAVYHEQPEIAALLAGKTVALTIFEAIAIGRLETIVRLLARKPQLVSTYSEDGFQPLGLACYFGNFEIAEYLVKAGAPLNSVSHNELKIAPIRSAAAGGYESIVKLLLTNGADPNVRERHGYTPLHAAAQNGDETMIRTLLYGGADMGLKGNDGKLPLDLARQAGHAGAARLLEEGITKRFKSKWK
jgi:ankyrin repeat protein